MKVGVQPATDQHLEQLNDIYNQYVRETHYTFDLEPISMEARREWFSHYADSGAVGTRVYEELFSSLKGEDVHRAYAGIALPNQASIALHERFGFKRVAHFTEQGRKFDRFWDVGWYEKPLGD